MLRHAKHARERQQSCRSALARSSAKPASPGRCAARGNSASARAIPGACRNSRSIDHGDREERDQSDHRTQAHRELRCRPACRAGRSRNCRSRPIARSLRRATASHRPRNIEEMLEEFRCHVLVDPVLLAEFEGDMQHVQAEHRHPGGAIGLLDVATGGQRARAVEHPDIVEAEEPALEDVQALRVLAVHPPGEVQQQLVEDPFQERDITGTAVPAAIVFDRRATPPMPAPGD